MYFYDSDIDKHCSTKAKAKPAVTRIKVWARSNFDGTRLSPIGTKCVGRGFSEWDNSKRATSSLLSPKLNEHLTHRDVDNHNHPTHEISPKPYSYRIFYPVYKPLISVRSS